ncbi:YicC/YloC family endoribonuclease [Neorhizobium galegae]|uniref:YicC/YloC family endoribonuclease n=1 Tax=Neorhizobium galegae TaxID=399 RepID=UPI0006223B27|nr:YicC/YloC family endoribonuclease [Neorhizobium galegae]CDZ27551.1 Protein YicC [Neorhizobium galegae bv. officinalis]KAA9386555.1 YicC family protein [Neorhizobium galegae]KAB1111050.1 YicC family protein [Neorhizobium galegae]MCM2498547.1 YicC family protein [Neorhizobium galegae]MCQ1772297.1 YicC family protein [Neorhizobium galegae]
MTLQSMTGFARSEGTSGRNRYAWELRSVNGKGLDIRLRLPPGLERLEPDVRRVISEKFSRGNLQATLTLTVAETKVEAVLNRDALAAVLALRAELGELVDPSPLRLDTLMGIRGLVDIREAEEDEQTVAARDAAILASLGEAIGHLQRMREGEGTALAAVLKGQVARIAELVQIVETDPSRTPEEIARKLSFQLAALLQEAPTLDRDRLHAEAALLATKADLREEIDRLKAHVAAANELIDKGGPVGRRLDFLAQEFNRESNTICSKSNSAAVTSAGIELKVVIDQFREQVQNLE